MKPTNQDPAAGRRLRAASGAKRPGQDPCVERLRASRIIETQPLDLSSADLQIPFPFPRTLRSCDSIISPPRLRCRAPPKPGHRLLGKA